MRTLLAETDEIPVRELIDAARHEPVSVVRDGKQAAVVLSPKEFERLDAQDRIRREAAARLKRTIAAIHQDITDRGLTEAEADRLLAEDMADGH